MGAFLVVLGASLWATDSLFRAPLSQRFPPLWIVMINHLFLALPCFFLLYRYHRELKCLTRRQWLGISYLAIFVSVLGTLAFTESFARSSNYSIPVLLQKLQPCFAILLAHHFLGERTRPQFWPLLFIAIMGTYLLSFGFDPVWLHLENANFSAIVYALVASVIWGSGTVVARAVLLKVSFPLVTALRFFLGAVFSLVLTILSGGWEPFLRLGDSSTVAFDLGNFMSMAFISGFFPIWLYYRGLQSTPAAVATLCELAFPLLAIMLNWYFLGATLQKTQILGAFLIVGSIALQNLVLPVNFWKKDSILRHLPGVLGGGTTKKLYVGSDRQQGILESASGVAGCRPEGENRC